MYTIIYTHRSRTQVFTKAARLSTAYEMCNMLRSLGMPAKVFAKDINIRHIPERYLGTCFKSSF